MHLIDFIDMWKNIKVIHALQYNLEHEKYRLSFKKQLFLGRNQSAYFFLEKYMGFAYGKAADVQKKKQQGVIFFIGVAKE